MVEINWKLKQLRESNLMISMTENLSIEFLKLTLKPYHEIPMFSITKSAMIGLWITEYQKVQKAY